MQLSKKTALVTGAGKGLGKVIAQEMASAGAQVILLYNRSAKEVEELAQSIKDNGGKAYTVQCDLADTSAVRAIFSNKIKPWLLEHSATGRLDILVNNAGVCERSNLFQFTEEQFDKNFSINLKSVLYLVRESVQVMNNNGRVINISSMMPEQPDDKYLLYALTKASIDVLTRTLVAELGKKGITINAVKPGPLPTDAVEGMNHPMVKDFIIKRTPMGRLGQPEDIAALVLFLASDPAQWITGQLIQAHGGFGANGIK